MVGHDRPESLTCGKTALMSALLFMGEIKEIEAKTFYLV